MPNWVYNILKILGPKKQLNEFEAIANKEKTVLSFNNFIEQPNQIKNWYDWNIANWGCKWDIQNVRLSKAKNYLKYSFDTPWSMPISFIIFVSTILDELTFHLKVEEEGRFFKGKLIIKAGEIIENKIK